MALPRRTTAIIAAVAFVMASISAYLVYSYLSKKEQEAAKARLEVEQVVVAVADIPFGSRIKPEQLAVADWPKKNLPKGSSNDVKKVNGRLAITSIPAGSPVLEGSLAPVSSSVGVLSYIIHPGKRAVTVAVNEVVGVAGFVLPNSMVDVVATVDSPYGGKTSRNDRISKIVLQNVRVLAVGQILEQKEGKPVSVPTVTLDVTPEDAEKLALASENKVQLILRHLDDSADVKTRGATVPTLLAGSSPAPEPLRTGRPVKAVKVAAPSAPSRIVVEVIKGSMRANETVR